MKKICDKINKQQWRLTVPLNTGIFKRSAGKDTESSDRDSKRSSSGFYDFQEAQQEFDKTRSLVYVDSSSSTTDTEEEFEDAKAMSDKSSNAGKEANAESEMELYADVLNEIKSKNIDNLNGKFEYDVPRISFKFNNDQEKDKDDESIYENDTLEKVTTKHIVKSEVKIVLKAPAEEEMRLSNGERPDEAPPEKYVAQTEILVRKSYEDIQVAIVRSGSDPNLSLRGSQDGDDNFYKIPRTLKISPRLSQSLDDLDSEETQQDPPTSSHSSIEHISCSQHNVNNIEERNANAQSDKLDYCQVRSKLPITTRRPTLLRKPNKAVDTWNNFKSKMNNIIIEHAAQQRVGAFGDRDKVTVNFEEMYKNSKTKCKKVLQNAEKIFKKKPGEYSDVESGNNTPTSAKNNAFFGKKFKASDIEYKLNTSDNSESKDCFSDGENELNGIIAHSPTDEGQEDFPSLRAAFNRRKLFVPEGQNGFEDLRRYVKQGGDFCKELATILQERSDAEAAYAKSLSKLGAKLSRACREAGAAAPGGDGWRAVAAELAARADAHRALGAALLDDAARPLRALTETQHRTRKQCEGGVEKAARLLAEWRAAEAKGKKHSHACARDNEKLQDAAHVDGGKYSKQTLSKSTSLIHLTQMHNKNSTDKENAKLEGKKKKAEDAVKKADIEYYTLCVRAERARLEWESAVLRGVNHFQSLEEERLDNLKTVLMSYLKHSVELNPRLVEATEGLKSPTQEADAAKDLSTFLNLRHTSQQVSEQLLPDFYCEHITLAMNRERRKQALIKLLHLIRQDIERERKSKNGLENLSKAIKQTPNFGTEDSQQSVTEKLYHMKSMLTYLEGARYKVQSALAELDSRPRAGHPLAQHITITRDKSGLQQSVLKVPQWLREEFFETDKSPMSEKSMKSNRSDNSDPHNNDVEDSDWPDRGAADGNSNQPDSDFDEFSSQCSSADGHSNAAENLAVVQPIARCRAIYPYSPNLPDELALRAGDILSVYRKQDDGWWLGECKGNVGIFPATYVQLMPS